MTDDDISKYGLPEQKEDLERLGVAQKEANVWRRKASPETQEPGHFSDKVVGWFEITQLLLRKDESARSFWEALATAFERQPEDRRFVQSYLAQSSWYLSESVSAGEIAVLAHYIENNQTDGIEEFLQNIARRSRDQILDKLTRHVPNRADILRQAFACHDRAEFAVCIPTMITQAEGIAFEDFGQPILSTKKNARKIRIKLQEHLDQIDEEGVLKGLFDSLMRQLTDPNAISESPFLGQDETNEEPRPLNRHAILHGHDVKYATEANSLRCILLLDYVCGVHLILQDELGTS